VVGYHGIITILDKGFCLENRWRKISSVLEGTMNIMITLNERKNFKIVGSFKINSIAKDMSGYESNTTNSQLVVDTVKD
jgi:hypothetical protein